ncbi:LA_2478/LA_2722/LA_4182 family protein [Leptospira sp. GIMC2001]|uniref:LA_2478/LA_2722/LA_4182 family protein n=1 Tax=Leptospira sp. GIMC2001 TaxID=1513297 RepID=UPI00234AFCA8|nr:hypothetical protein [Leptospira sp. GIMC2001]WCL50536.1 hypothetical protein O4O04_06870 [Leptospira sp. GIMC2001]
MENSVWKIEKKAKLIASLNRFLFLLIFLSANCSPKIDKTEIVKIGKRYPEVLCEKIEACARLELETMNSEDRKEALAYLPTKENCLVDQLDAKVLPTAINDPEIGNITQERLDVVKSCIKGIQTADCNDLDSSYSIQGCEELYNIGN